MAAITVNAKRILDYLSETSDPMRRGLSPIRDELRLSKHDLLRALDELESQQLIEQREQWYDLTAAGWDRIKQGEESEAPGETAPGQSVQADRTGGVIQADRSARVDYAQRDRIDVGGDYLTGRARKIDTGGGDYIERGGKTSVEGGGVAAGGDLNVSGGTVAGRDVIRSKGDQIKIGGDVGPGAAIGSGATVKAGNIAGGDIRTGARGDPAREAAALRNQLTYLREDLDIIGDEDVRRQAERWIARLDRALGLNDPSEADPSTIRVATDWLMGNAPSLTHSVRGILKTPFVQRLLQAE